jgi:hypothetical protein
MAVTTITKSLTTVLLLTAVASAAAVAGSQERYQVSLSGVPLGKNERVVAFELKVNAGAVDSVRNMPAGWHVEVDNDASWTTRVTGGATVGAAALDAERLQNISFTLLKNEFEGLQFKVSAEVVATTDFQTERHIPLQLNNLHPVRP